jgi:two-component system LytT family sensor kinase
MHYREANILAQTLGFGLGSVLSALLLVLVYRSGGEDRVARFFFAVCILIANYAGLFKNVCLFANPDLGIVFANRIRAIGFAAGALSPCGIISIWRANAITPLRRQAGRWVMLYSILSGVVIATLVMVGAWTPPIFLSRASGLSWLMNQDAIGNLTIFNGLLTIVVGGILLLPGTLKGPTDQIAMALMFSGLLISTVGAVLFVRSGQPAVQFAQVARFQGILLLVIGVLFYFSHFRAADIFTKYALRLLVASALSISGAVALTKPIYTISLRAPLPSATFVLLASMLICTSIIVSSGLTKWIDLIVERGIFGKRDPRQVVRDFREQVLFLESGPAVMALFHSVAATALAMKPEDILADGQPLEGAASQAETIVRIPSNGSPIQLGISVRGSGRTLLTSEIELLNEIALHASRRLDDLEREEERIERVRIEGHLGKQLVEAELRALRSQINPHFLFNCLNTIASLIPSEPDKAEKMTVRLSSIFRYVLAHSHRPFTCLGEEMDFLRTLLEIEQIRFGDRLTVAFDVESATEMVSIPSLILQPLVENAIKHGIAPKIGKSLLTITAKCVGETVRIDVEDDGIGLQSNDGSSRVIKSRLTNGTGIGLQNIRERLNSLYGTSASFQLINQQTLGVRATIVIPVNGGKDADSSIAG